MLWQRVAAGGLFLGQAVGDQAGQGTGALGRVWPGGVEAGGGHRPIRISEDGAPIKTGKE